MRLGQGEAASAAHRDPVRLGPIHVATARQWDAHRDAGRTPTEIQQHRTIGPPTGHTARRYAPARPSCQVPRRVWAYLIRSAGGQSRRLQQERAARIGSRTIPLGSQAVGTHQPLQLRIAQVALP